MYKEIFKNLLKDRVVLILFFLLGQVSVIVFFRMSDSGNTEFMYPFSISGFFLITFLLIDWYRYYETNRAVYLQLNDEYTEIQPHTEEQKNFQRLLHKVVEENARKQNKMIEDSRERLYFLSHWMHYLKTPVSVITLILNKERKRSELIEKVEQENKRLHMSIEQGLTMIRMENFENDLEVKSVDLLLTLRNIMNERKREFIYQSIFPSIECEGEQAYIVTDSKWNEIMLDQIISNALKYSGGKSGNKRLQFRIKKEERYTTLSVIDEGVGIPPYDIERVFQPFFTGENGRTYKNSSGIGLYLCKKIADKLGHKITIHSEVAKGTTVTIRWITGRWDKHE